MDVAHDDLPAVLAARDARRRGARAALRAGYVRAASGVHVVTGTDLDDPDVRTRVAMAAVPDEVTLGGWAAARLHERAALAAARAARGGRPGRRQADPMAWFDGRDDRVRGGQGPVLLLAPPEVRLEPGPGRRLLRSRVAAGERVVLEGLPATSALRTAFDLARLGPETEAVVALDRLRALDLLDPGDLEELIRSRRRWRGTVAARRALELSAGGVESPQETRLRMVWLAAGLPAPLCNAVVLDPDHRFVARVDLLDPTSGLVGEYDGAVHADADRRSSDAGRQERLCSLGMEVVRATSADLVSATARARWQHRARLALRRALGRRADARWLLGAVDRHGPRSAV
ncbi:hypothetical protein [Cellulomonas pakistanensis]|uniref:DUF559 domain-containing protein n=1 Tax=Cellulomonas pakistanensis TaxID=992287 RepID=A0A919U5U7_9CELL|nr:hypothetical protein [Cellulomonas pakistanensis]GIG36384.1 hypothetical protein Cpa01nite_17650 [Cellulomonas pakistanensis]